MIRVIPMDSHIWPTFCCSYRIDSYTLFHGFFCRRNKVTAETVWVSWTADGIGNQTSYSIMHQGIEGSGLFHGMDTKWRGTTRSMMQWWGSIITCPIDFLSPRFTHSYDLDWCAARAQQCLLGKRNTHPKWGNCPFEGVFSGQPCQLMTELRQKKNSWIL